MTNLVYGTRGRLQPYSLLLMVESVSALTCVSFETGHAPSLQKQAKNPTAAMRQPRRRFKVQRSKL